MRSYEAARSLYSFLEFIAWAVVVTGVIVALMGAAGASKYGGSAAGLLAMVPGIGIGITGFILVAFVQMGRATVDTAEYSQQMLKLSRDQLEVSKQSLKAQNSAPQTFAAATQQGSNQDQKASFASQANNVESSGQTISDSGPDNFVPEDTIYRGKTIRAEKGKFLYKGVPFDTLGAAKDYVDTFRAVPTRKLSSAPVKT